MARPTVVVQSSSLWFEQHPIHLHQAYEASDSIVEEVRNTNYPIFGRHAVDGRSRKRGKGGLQHSSILTNITGLYCEHGKEHRVSITTNRVPGFQSGFTQDDYCSPNTETSITMMSGKTYEGCQADYSEGNTADAWFDGSCPSSYTPSSTSLQTAGEDQIILPQTGLVIRIHGPSLPIHEIRFVMVDRQG